MAAARRRSRDEGPPPLRSMTGYGRGRSENRAAAAEVELRAVNGKALSVKLRIPGDRLELEPRVDALLRRRLARGSLQGSVRVRLLRRQGEEVNLDALRQHLRAWRRGEKELGLAEEPPTMAQLLALPDAFCEVEESEAVRRAVQQAVDAAAREAVERLQESRALEGERLRKELGRLVRRFRAVLGRVEKRLPRAQQEAEQRMRERLNRAWQALDGGDPVDFTREFALAAERADVREEIARLRIHVERVAEVMEAGGAMGRELEFLLQECHREVTTLGNKSADAALSSHVVELKLVVQQLKEQVANVE